MNKELTALINLLEDPDPEVIKSIIPQIQAYGLSAIEPLDKAIEAAVSSEHFHRIEDLVSEIKFDNTRNRTAKWISSGICDLQVGYQTVCELVNPPEQVPPDYQQISLFNDIRNEIWLELNKNLTALEKIRVLNFFFYEKHGYHQDIKNPDHLSRFSLTRLSANKVGNEQSILAAYSIISRNLDLPIYGVNIPGLSLLAYLDLPFSPKPGFNPSKSPVLFFIHPGENGRIFGIEEVKYFLTKFYPEMINQPIQPSSNSIMVKHFTRALLKSSKKLGKNETQRRARDLLSLWESTV